MDVKDKRKPSIAIVGVGFRLPGDVSKLDDLWRVLQNGENLISQVDEDRFNFQNYLHPRSSELGKSYTFKAGVLSRIDEFDAEFFGISPREARQMDPQQRLLLETTWAALEQGRQNIDDMAGSDCAVYIGISGNEHIFKGVNDASVIDSYTMLGNCTSIAANRISYLFDLHGPSMAIDTACSSSLVALHQACNSIWTGEASMAIAGGVNLFLSPNAFIGFSKASMLSPEGQCKSFAEGGNGYVRSEGCVVLFLKPLADAERDGDPIHAVILNSGVNSDGHTQGIALPSAASQADLLNRVYSKAGIQPDEIQYLEAHGTGTVVGDHAETLALSEALATKREKGNPLLIGSIKSNLGHLEPVSGLTGVLKILLCLQHQSIPPTLYSTHLNPDISFDDLNLKVVASEISLPVQEKPMIMAVNSFGFGGTNAHVILGQYLAEERALNEVAGIESDKAVAHHLNPAPLPPLTLRFRGEEALPLLAKQYLSLLLTQPQDYYAIAYALAHQRMAHKKGAIVHGDDLAAIMQNLELLAEGSNPSEVITEQWLGKNTPVALVYSGNGAQWHGMAVELLQNDALVIETISEIDSLFAQYADFSIQAELLAAEEHSRLDETEVAQPCIFAVQVAITRYLLQKGVNVTAVTGHSVGEIAAAWASGALSLAQAVEVIYKRSYWQGKTRGQGRMMAVALSAQDAASLIEKNSLRENVCIAAVNSPKGVTVAGSLSGLEILQSICEEQGVFNRLLDLDYAFHTQEMDCIRDDLLHSLDSLQPEKDAIKFVSTVTGTTLPGIKLNADYWWQNVRCPVQFHEAIKTLLKDDIQIFIEVGPHSVLKTYMEEAMRSSNKPTLVIQTLKRQSSPSLDLKRALFRIWLSGAQFDASYFFPTKGQRMSLPPYPLVKESYWLVPSNENANQVDMPLEHPLLGRRIKSTESIWENHLDTALVPYLADHLVDGVAVMPAAGFAEMALAAARSWYEGTNYEFRDFDILAPMVFEEKICRIVRFELQAASGDFVIQSRARHTTDPWITHVVGRLLANPVTIKSAGIDILVFCKQAKLSEQGQLLYVGARELGLDYGPAFQCIEQVWFQEENALARVNLSDDQLVLLNTHCVYPGVLDACFQLLIALLSKKNACQDVFLPIRIGQMKVFETLPQAIYLTAKIVLRSKHSVLADFTIADQAGNHIAVITGCRFQKAYLSGKNSVVKQYVCKPHLLSSSEPRVGFDWPHLQSQLSINNGQETGQSVKHFEEVMPLIDLMIGYFIYQAILELRPSPSSVTSFTFSELAKDAKIPEAQHLLLRWCLNVLCDDGLLQRESDGRFTLTTNESVDAQQIWQLLLSNHPQYQTELILLGRLGLHWPKIVRGEVQMPQLLAARNGNLLKQFLEDSTSVSGIYETVMQTISSLLKQWPKKQRIRILDIGYSCSPLTTELISFLPVDTDYTLMAEDESVQRFFEGRFINCLTMPGSVAEIKSLNEKFDIILVRNYLREMSSWDNGSMQLHHWLAPKGVLLMMEQTSDRLYEFVLGSQPNWWHENQIGEPQSRLNSASYWQKFLKKAGYQVATPLFEPGASETEGAFLLTAQPQMVSSDAASESGDPISRQDLALVNRSEPSPNFLIIEKESNSIGVSLYKRLKALCAASLVVKVKPPSAESEEQAVITMQKLLQPFIEEQKKLRILWVAGDEAQESSVAVLHLLQAIKKAQWFIPPQVILVTQNALPVVAEAKKADMNPMQGLLWGMGRVIYNEYPDLACKLVDLQGDITSALLDNACNEFLNSDNEAEIVLTSDARYGVRIELSEGIVANHTLKKADYRLDFIKGRSLNNLNWLPIQKPVLSDDEVMVKPEVSGLNFRDVMYAMGLLPDEAVENGFLGASLGMEFAGEVLATGSGVSEFKPGDRVVGFAPACFSSMTVTKAHAITPLPSQWSFAAAATIPIAFFTAYYALQYLARLDAGERVLIHGAAGGVGLAAIQIAKHLGAEIYATAGSEEKRDFLRLMGVSNLYDSRTLAFEGEILADTGNEGVDVVLNCLAGEAINANLAILKPFGRFLELGKRDFFANSKIGLRPFRNNISYFGIDADQLLMKNPVLCTRLFKEMMGLFAEGILSPLPYHQFGMHHIHDAFRYMQQSRHVGKIVVSLHENPHHPIIAQDYQSSLRLSAQDAYLVTGGFNGFGLQTAKWLVRIGAKHLILIGRSGAASPEAQEALIDFKNQGVEVSVHAMDIADAQAVDELVMGLKTNSVSLKGVIHAAAVYDDGLLQNLNSERMQKVLAPKVQGAWNLHNSTRECSLDFFVLYSSVTTLFGNPGQANYVAANAYLESLVHQRRALDLPALFVGWGPISDAGYLARNEKIKQVLTAKTGNQTLSAQQALKWLERLILTKAEGIALAHLNLGRMQQHVPLLNSPKFSKLLEYEHYFGELSHEQPNEIRALLADKSHEEAMDLISHLLISEVAHILRLPAEKIDSNTSLLDLGMDSLVGAELSHAIEERFSLQIPMLTLSQGISVRTIGEKILAQLNKEKESTEEHDPAITRILHEAALHGEEVSTDAAMKLNKELQESILESSNSG